jgi:hypothetical protein
LVFELFAVDFSATRFRLSTEILVAADYDGDGKTDIAVFHNGIWYQQRSQAGFFGVAFGTATHNRFLMRLFLKLLEHQNNKSGERFNACRFCFALFDKDFSVCFAEFVPNVRQPGNNYNETIFIFEQAEFKRRLPRKLVAAGFDLARLSDIRIPKIIVTIKNPTVFYG